MKGVVASAMCGMLVAGCIRKEEIVLPDGFRGWVVIRANDPKCPYENARLIRVDTTGRGCMRASLEEGPYRSVVHSGSAILRQTAHGGGGMIWGEATSWRAGKTAYIFFVGAESEFSTAGSAPLRLMDEK